jgi:uncharacterized protein (DUF2252 family)
MTAKAKTAKSAHDLVLAFYAGREPERLAIKYKKMATDPIAFERGSCHLFYHRLAELGALGSAPAAWSCNDLHLENFGTYLGDNGLVYFDVNDFDEACLAPSDWDILRLATSILVAGRYYEVARKTATSVATQAIDGYQNAILNGKPGWIERKTADGPIGKLMDTLKKRGERDFYGTRIKIIDGRPMLNPDYDNVLPISKDVYVALRDLVGTTVDPDSAAAPSWRLTMLDAARRVAGVGGLGQARFVILAERSDRPGKPLLIDLKASHPTSTVAHSPFEQPVWGDAATRIVTLQHRGQAATPKFLRAVRFADAPFVLRELQPSEDRLKVKKLAKDEADFASTARSMAALTAWLHLRSAGRQGSATADALIEHVSAKGIAADILARARQADAAVEADYKDFATAFADGAVTA